MQPIVGFVPDADPTTPGVLREVDNIIPTVKGFAGAPTGVDAGFAAVSTTVNAMVNVTKLDGSRRVFVGTETTLEEGLSLAWTDRSGSTYNCGTGTRWSFSQYANATLAANKGDLIQVSTTGAFADISGSPKATYIASNGGFVMAVNMATGANPNHQTDGFHCCAYNDYTDWTESISTQCTSGRLISEGGEITGIKAFGDGFVVFKENTMYLARYVGAPIVWEFDEVPGNTGCPTGHAAVNVEDRIFFIGNDGNFYYFDGARPVSIGEGVRDWFSNDISTQSDSMTLASYNEALGQVTWHYISNDGASTNCDRALVYNTRSKKWGKMDVTVEAAAVYLGDQVTYDNYEDYYATYAVSDVTYRALFYMGGIISSAYIDTSHKLTTLTGASSASSMCLYVMGDDEQFSTISRVRPRFLTEPTTAQLVYSYDDDYGDDFTYKNRTNLANGKFDLLHSSRWHECVVEFSGDIEVIGFRVDLRPDGYR